MMDAMLRHAQQDPGGDRPHELQDHTFRVALHTCRFECVRCEEFFEAIRLDVHSANVRVRIFSEAAGTPDGRQRILESLHSSARNVRDVRYPRCNVPPPGWTCTRERGHEGPCAALPFSGEVGIFGGPDFVGRIPARTELTVLPADPPREPLGLRVTELAGRAAAVSMGASVPYQACPKCVPGARCEHNGTGRYPTRFDRKEPV